MVRVIGLVVVVAACWTCAPAQADVLRVELPSATASAAANAVGSVTPAVAQVAKSSPARPTHADDTIRNATAATQPAVNAAVATTTAQVAQVRAGDTRGLRVGASSLRRVPPTRLRHAAASAQPSAPVRDTPASRSADRSPALLHRAPSDAATSHPATARPEHKAPSNPQPGPRADGGISAGAAGLFAGGLAMLAGALMLVAPRLHRRLPIDPAVPRPAAFVALLERPG